MLPEFELLVPQSLLEALSMLADRAPGVLPLAGGTNLIVTMREERPSHQVLMDISRLEELRGIRREDGQVVMGGGTKIAELVTHPLIAETAPPLKAAARVLGSPLVRNRATVAGNLVDASPAADTAPPLLVLNAEVELARKGGKRRLALEDFFVGPNETLCQADELLAAVRWPVPSPGSVAVFHKIGLRNALACSVVTAAVMVESSEGGYCQEVRIALGAVAPRPIRVHEAEDVLRDQQLTPDRIDAAARLSAGATSPIDDVRASATYRRRIAAVLVRRLLTEIASSAIFRWK
jgi:CO/xanthine dehydrogenase FAD-binding subunit